MKSSGTWAVLPAIVLTCCFSHYALAGPMPKTRPSTQPGVPTTQPDSSQTQPGPLALDAVAKLLTEKVGGKWTKRDKLMNLGPALVAEVPAAKGRADRYIVVPFRFNARGKAAISVYVNSVAWVFDVLGSNKRRTVLVQSHPRGPNEKVNNAVISALNLRPCPVTLKAKTRVKTLKGKRGSFRILIHCPGGKGKPHQSLSLRAASGRETWPTIYPTAHLSPAQVDMIITYLTYDGFLDRAINIEKAAARHPGYDVCTLWVYDAEANAENIYVGKLGWGLETLDRLDGLRSVLYGDAGKAMDAFLANFAEQRRLWEKRPATQPATTLRSSSRAQPAAGKDPKRRAAPTTRPAGWSDTIKGLRVRLVCDRGKFIVGEPIHVRLDLECTRVQPKGKAGCQLFPHVSFRLAKVTKRVKLPIKNRLVVLKGKTFSRHFDVTKIYSLARPGRYVFVAGHENQTAKDIGDWTGDVQSPPLTIEVLGDTPGNRKAVERAGAGVWVAAVTGRHPRVPFSNRTIMARAQVTGDLRGREVCGYPWSKDGPPNVLRLDWSKKIGPKGKSPSVLVTLHTNRPQPGEQSNVQVMRFYTILGQDRYLPRIELPIEFAGFAPLRLFRHEGHNFVWVYVDRKGGGESRILHLDGRTVRSIPSEDPGGKITALLKENEVFNNTTRRPYLTASFRHYEKGTRRFPSWEKVFRQDARGRTHEVARIEVVYRLEKDVSGRPVRLVADKADRKELLSGRALAPAELGRLCAKIEKNGTWGCQLHRIDWRQIPAEHKDRIVKAIATEQMQRDKDADVAMVRALSWFDDEFVFERLSELADSASARARCLACEALPYREPFAARATALLERLLQEEATGGRYSAARAAFATLSRMATKRARQLSVRYFLRHVEPYLDYRRVVYGQTGGWWAFLHKQEGAVAVPWLVRLATSEDQRAAQSAKSDLWWFASHQPELKHTAYDAMDDPPGWLKANEKPLRPWIERAKNLAAQLETPRRPDKARPAATQPATTRPSSSQAQPATKAPARVREVRSS